MKWSELPQEYRDLEKGFNISLVAIDIKNNNIRFKFKWDETPQGYDFWIGCHIAKIISELPPIPNIKPIEEPIELLKEIQEYFERKENRDYMPLWLADKIEKVINQK